MPFAVYPQSDPRSAEGEFSIEVLAQDHRLIACFVCPVEAFRYAALLHDQTSSPMLRRTHDGAAIPFDDELTARALIAWSARPLATYSRPDVTLGRRAAGSR